ncbi:MAG: site-specific DNA-methyltransferase [Bacteroidota bacterium]
MDGSSLDLRALQLQKLREAFPEAVSEQGIDWEKLRRTLGDDIALTNERYVLNWAGKSDAFKAIQTPTTATLKPQREQSIDFDTTQNIFIEGENLEVLKVLQKSYYGKVKMIYIDPPYNTGNDSFIYPDKFSETKEEYLKKIGDKDEAGYLTKEGFFRKNSKENGQFHSNWLSMMYPRLFLARNLLRDDGVIFVSIDDNEVHNLRLIMNEVFGEENFVVSITWQRKVSPSNDAQWFSSDHDYILVYAKSKETWFPIRLPMNERQKGYYKNPDNDSRGEWNSATYTCNKSKSERPNLYYPIVNPNTKEETWPRETAVWAYSREMYDKHVEENLIYWGVDGKARMPRLKNFLTEAGDVVPRSIWNYADVGHTQEATRELLAFLPSGGFNSPKPSRLLKRILQISSSSATSDIVLDFFAGSGTTAQAVLELNKEDGGNRKFILVQLPEKTDEESEVHKAGHETIADICKERMAQAIAKIKAEVDDQPNLFASRPLDLGFKVLTLESSNFKVWRTDVIETEEELKKQMNAFVDPVRVRSEADNMAWEILLKSGYELTTPMETLTLDGGVPVYSIAEGELILMLESVTQEAIEEIIRRKPKRVICLDRLFTGDDQLKTNTVLQMKDAGIEFRTI